MSKLFALFILAGLIPVTVFANDYKSGHQALEVFDLAGWENTPSWVKYWIVFMFLSFVSGLLFVKNHLIARWVVGGFIAGLIVTKIVSSTAGILPLSGFIALIHLIFWSPALFLLLKQRPFANASSAFAIWTAVITFVILFSFIFDIRDAAIYLRHII